MKELEIEAQADRLYDVQNFVDGELERVGCPMKIQNQIDLVVEEIFINIASYAYAPPGGKAMVRVEFMEEPLTITLSFLDGGEPYDPLAREDPDVTLSAEDRPIGGLGIFLVKKIMDDIQYEYKDGRNILTLKKQLVLKDKK